MTAVQRGRLLHGVSVRIGATGDVEPERRAGFATPNLVVAIPDANRQICIYSHGRSDLLIDLSGWWSDGPNRFASIVPQRVYDSRQPGFSPLAPLQVREVRIPSSVIPAGSAAAVVNLTRGRRRTSRLHHGVPVRATGTERVERQLLRLRSPRRRRDRGARLGELPVRARGHDRRRHRRRHRLLRCDADVRADRRCRADRRASRRRQPNGIGGPLRPLAAGEVRSFDPVEGLANAADTSAAMLNFVSTDAAASDPDGVSVWRGRAERVDIELRRARRRRTSRRSSSVSTGGCASCRRSRRT